MGQLLGPVGRKAWLEDRPKITSTQPPEVMTEGDNTHFGSSGSLFKSLMSLLLLK